MTAPVSPRLKLNVSRESEDLRSHCKTRDPYRPQRRERQRTSLKPGSADGEKIDLEVKEIKSPDLNAYLVAENIANQLTRRISYRRAMQRAIQQGMRQGAEGVKVMVSGRLGGAEMSRSVWLREGRVPLQTLRADIDYAQTEALTTYGQIGSRFGSIKAR